MDAVASNPPYSQEWDPKELENDPRFVRFGLAPKSKADFAFLLHALYHVKPGGIMTIVLPHGVLYRGDSEYQIRMRLIENNHIDAIIGLPEKMFFGTGIATIIMVLKRQKTRADDRVLFIDASRGFSKEGKSNRLRACDIRRIVDTVTQRRETPDYSRLAPRDEIRRNDYNLNITRYVDSSPRATRHDIYATMFGGIPPQDLNSLARYWKAFPSLRGQLLSVNAQGYSQLRTQELRQVIAANADVKAFEQAYREAFGGFEEFIDRELIAPMLTLSISQCEEAIARELFRRLEPFTLIDAYQAYQFVNDEWQLIASDLEVLQTEGLDAARQVEWNMVPKKREERIIEVHDGVAGRMLPFALVQRELLPERLARVEALGERIEAIEGELEALVESLPPEAQNSPILDDDNAKFLPKEVRAEAKRILEQIETPEIALLEAFPDSQEERERFVAQHPHLGWARVAPARNGYGKAQVKRLIELARESYRFEEGSYEEAVQRADRLLTESEEAKKRLREEQAGMERATRERIETLRDEEVVALLRVKWLSPLFASLRRMPDEVASALAAELLRLSEAYGSSYAEVAARAREAEGALRGLLGELQGAEADELGLAAFLATLAGSDGADLQGSNLGEEGRGDGK